MAATQLIITLPEEMAELVHRKIASGAYASESEVIAESLVLMEGEEQQLERWLREDVLPACIEFDKDRTTAVSATELLADLDNRRNSRRSA